MGSESTEPSCKCQNQENQNLHTIEEVVERQNHWPDQRTVEIPEEGMEIRDSRADKCKTADLNQQS